MVAYFQLLGEAVTEVIIHSRNNNSQESTISYALVTSLQVNIFWYI